MAHLDVTNVIEAKLLWIQYEEEDGKLKPVLAVPDGKGYVILKEEVAGRKNLSRVGQQLSKNIDARRGIPVSETPVITPDESTVNGRIVDDAGVGQI